jgi:hypothetical protein
MWDLIGELLFETILARFVYFIGYIILKIATLGGARIHPFIGGNGSTAKGTTLMYSTENGMRVWTAGGAMVIGGTVSILCIILILIGSLC